MESNTLNNIILGICRAKEEYRVFFTGLDVSYPATAFPDLYPAGSSYYEYYLGPRETVNGERIYFSNSDGQLYYRDKDAGVTHQITWDPDIIRAKILCAIADFFMYEIPLIIFTNPVFSSALASRGLDIKSFVSGIENVDELDPKKILHETVAVHDLRTYVNEYYETVRDPLGAVINLDSLSYFIGPVATIGWGATNGYGILAGYSNRLTGPNICENIKEALKTYGSFLKGWGKPFSGKDKLALEKAFYDVKHTIEERLLEVLHRCADFRKEYDRKLSALRDLIDLMKEVGLDPAHYEALAEDIAQDISDEELNIILMRLKKFNDQLAAYMPRFKYRRLADAFSESLMRVTRPDILIEDATNCILDCIQILDNILNIEGDKDPGSGK